MQKTIYLLVGIALCFGFELKSQNALKSFQWRDFLPYNQAFSVTHQGNKIYAVANECIFSYNKDDHSYQKLNKITGLSDIEPLFVKNNPYNNALIIIYKNSNIDVIKNGGITNVGDLLRAQNLGNKTVNNITLSGKSAYLACGFGIAVFDTDALQFSDKYIIGPGGTNLNVYQVAVSTDSIYAATSKGIFCAALNSSNLASYTNWRQVTNLPVVNGIYNGIVSFGGNIIACYSGNLTTPPASGGPTNIDTLYKFNGTSWSKYPFNIQADKINNLIVSDDNKQFIYIDGVGFQAFDASGNNLIRAQYGFPTTNPSNNWWTFPNDVMPDPTDAGWYWQADRLYGLLKLKNTTTIPQVYGINGPVSSGCAQVQIKDDKVIVAPVYLGYQKAPFYLQYGVFSFFNDTWRSDITSTPSNLIFDINCVAFDYNDNSHFYAGSFGNGLLEVKNDSTVAQYTYTNSPIPHRVLDNNTQVTGLCSDLNNNLWIGTNDNPKFLTVKKNDNTWASLDFTPMLGNISALDVQQMITDSSNQTWVATYGAGVILYKNDGNYTQPQPNANLSNYNCIQLTSGTGKGGLPSNNIVCITQDKNSDIWVGTDQGIYVFYSPESILTQSSGWDAQPIYVQQDGQTQLLLQTNVVNSIFVDGSNNKWVGTSTSGLFYFSPDGQTQLYHFTTDNSPLFSNNVLSVNVNKNTGEVFIATDKGLQSFQNTSIEGLNNFESVYAYPNPVKPGYTGPILIHGLISGSTVQIVDAGGNFVYQTTSEGGQAIWNGQNFKGTRVASGIYMAICATPDGSQKKLTKILLLN